MKKLICLILGIMIAAGCLSGLAESTDSSFVQIRENVRAKVYAKPGAAEAVDTLQGGRICGLLEETNEAGGAWLFVFYLDGAKKGRTGYISAEYAVRLSQDDLTALLEDPEKFNEILDLIDAVNEYLKTSEPGDYSLNNSTSQANNRTEEKGLQQFYKDAMEKLQKVFSKMGSIDLSAAADAAGEIGDKVKAAGEDLLDLAKDTAESVKDDLEEKADEAREKLQDVDLSAKLEEVKEKVKDIDPEASLEKLKDQLENSELNEKIKDLKEKIDDSSVGQLLDDLKTKTEDAVQDQVDSLMDTLNDSGLMDKIQDLQTVVNDLKNAGAGVGEKLNAVKDELIALFGSD